MKIVIHSLAELLELAALIKGGSATQVIADARTAGDLVTVDWGLTQAQREALELTGIKPDHVALVEPGVKDGDVTDPLPETGEVAVDADGVPHDTDWHSDPPKLNAGTGTWRARRKRDEDAYQAWLSARREADAAAADAAVSNAEPVPEGVATETHALPQSEPEADVPENGEVLAAPAATGQDLVALVAASLQSAGDASDSMQDLLTACRDFVSSHSTTAFNALKHAVAPLEGSETGVAVQSLTPVQRRLMRACMDNYALFV